MRPNAPPFYPFILRSIMLSFEKHTRTEREKHQKGAN